MTGRHVVGGVERRRLRRLLSTPFAILMCHSERRAAKWGILAEYTMKFSLSLLHHATFLLG